MVRDELINFVNRLYGRSLEKRKASGITQWIICSSFIVISYKLYEDFFSIKTINFDTLYQVIFFAFYLIFFSSFFAKPLYQRQSFNITDYRVSNNFRQNSILKLLYFSIPALLIYKFDTLPTDLALTAYYNLIFITFINSVFFLFSLSKIINLRLNNYPLVSEVENDHRKSKATSLLVNIFLLVNLYYFFSNGYSTYLLIDKIIDAGNEKNEKILLFCVGFIILYFLLFEFLISRKSESTDIYYRLNRLDRDIVLYKIKDEEIIARIENEILEDKSLEFLLKEKRAEINIASKAILDAIQDIYESLSTPNPDNPLISQNEALKQHFSSFDKKSTSYLKWLLKLSTSMRFSNNLLCKEIITLNISEHEKTISDIRKETTQLKLRIHEIINEEN